MGHSENRKKRTTPDDNSWGEDPPRPRPASPTRRRQRRGKHQRAGGRWGDGFRDRLRRLICVGQQSQAAFAAAVGVSAARVTEWLAGEQLPSAECLQRIAEATEVSLDWLFVGIDHAGQQRASPVYQGQWRESSALEHDLATAIFREVHQGRNATSPGLFHDPGVIDCQAVIQYVATEILQYDKRFYAAASDAAAYLKFVGTAGDLIVSGMEIPENIARRIDHHVDFLYEKLNTLAVPSETDCRFFKPVMQVANVEELQDLILTILQKTSENHRGFTREWGSKDGIERIRKILRALRLHRLRVAVQSLAHPTEGDLTAGQVSSSTPSSDGSCAP